MSYVTKTYFYNIIYETQTLGLMNLLIIIDNVTF